MSCQHRISLISPLHFIYSQGDFAHKERADAHGGCTGGHLLIASLEDRVFDALLDMDQRCLAT
jgi:hypothetical protein